MIEGTNYRCDDCGVTTEGCHLSSLLKYYFPDWIKFSNGKTYCPKCKDKRWLKSGFRATIEQMLAIRELKKETGIENQNVLYRLWQLRGPFPDTSVEHIDGNEYLFWSRSAGKGEYYQLGVDGVQQIHSYRDVLIKRYG